MFWHSSCVIRSVVLLLSTPSVNGSKRELSNSASVALEGKFLSSFAVDGTKSKIIGQSVKQNFDYLLQQTVIF